MCKFQYLFCIFLKIQVRFFTDCCNLALNGLNSGTLLLRSHRGDILFSRIPISRALYSRCPLSCCLSSRCPYSRCSFGRIPLSRIHFIRCSLNIVYICDIFSYGLCYFNLQNFMCLCLYLIIHTVTAWSCSRRSACSFLFIIGKVNSNNYINFNVNTLHLDDYRPTTIPSSDS